MPTRIGSESLSAALAILFAFVSEHAMAQAIQGTASYRERMALPSGAVFEATLEDVSHSDAPASVIATTRLASPGNPPIRFSSRTVPPKSSSPTSMLSERASALTASSSSQVIQLPL
jgi:uncharacterized lipoprotein YbaY